MKTKQWSINFEAVIEDKLQDIRCFEVPDLELSKNQVVNLLVKEALKARGIKL